MAENAGAIVYTVEADTKKLLDGAQRADTSLDGLQKTFDKTDKAADKTQFQLTKTATAAKQLAAEAQLAQSPLGGLTKLLAGLVTVQGAMSLITMTEQYGEMAERIRMATSSTEEYEMVQARLLDTANNTYRSMREAQEIYIQTGDTLRSMGYSTEQALDVVDSLSYSFVKNATSTERANSAMSAFTGAMMTGKLEADGWKTIIAAVPSIINDIAASTGKTASEIRAMGASGKLAATDLSEGLRSALDTNKTAAEGMATTVKDAFTQLRNNLGMYVGEANAANGATGLLSKSIMLFGQNLDTVVNLLLVAGSGALAKYIMQMGSAAAASMAAAMQARASAAAELQKAQALVASTAAAAAHSAAMVGLGGATAKATADAVAHAAAQKALAAAQLSATQAGVGLMAVLGGPLGIISLLASAATAAVLFGTNAAAAAPDVDKLTDSIDKLTAVQLENRKLQAQDAIGQLRKKAIESGDAVRGLEKDFEALTEAQARGAKISAEELGNVKRAIVEQKAEQDGSIKQLQAAYDAEMLLAKAQEQRANAGNAKSTFKPTVTADPEAAKRLQGMREELELAKLTGEARAKLQAIQKLGDKATAEQRAEAEQLAVQIFKASEAQKALTAAKKEGTKDSDKELKKAESYLENLQRQSQEVKTMTAQEQVKYDVLTGVVKLGKDYAAAMELAAKIDFNENAAVFKTLATAIGEAALSGEELAKAKARASLNKAATPEEIAAIEGMASAQWKLNEAKQREQDIKVLDKQQGANQNFANDMLLLQQSLENKEILESQYDQLRLQRITEFEEQKRALQEETFRKQSAANDMLMSSLDALKGAGTSAMAGLITGSMTAGDAARALGNAILNSVVGSLVTMGVEYVKSLIMGKTAQAASTAVSVAAAATTAAAWAPAAAMVSLASFGANAAPAAAGIVSTASIAQGASLLGGRQYGGPVQAGGMYRVNENGAPEVFNAANGRQYMLSNTRGEVVSNKDAAGGKSGANITINLIEDANRAGQVENTTDQNGDAQTNIFVRDIRGGGDMATTLENTYGLTRQGN